MKDVVALARHSLRRMRLLLLVMLVVLAGFQLLLNVAGSELQRSNTFSNFAAMMPPFIRQMFGDSLFVFMSYTGLVAFGYFHPMVIAALVGLAIAIGTEPAAEIETRFLDLVLSRPVSRPAVVARSVLLMLLAPALIIAAMVLATTLGLRWLVPVGVPAPRTHLFVSLATNLWAVVACAGALALVCAAVPRRRSTAVGVVSVYLLVAFLVDYLSRFWKPATHVSWLSPFHYFDATAMVMGRALPWSHVAVLLSTAFAAVACAFVIFSRRDL